MRTSIRIFLISMAVAAVACGGGSTESGGGGNTAGGGGDTSAPAEGETFGPLTVGADWQSYTKISGTPSDCTDHGGRLCEFYINDVGLAAYKDENADVPEGTVIVKTSWEKNADGSPGESGPVFVMEKRGADYAPENDNWYYAIHWEKASGKWAGKAPTPLYWQSPSKKVGYCVNCHSGYDRQLGGLPEENRAENW